MRQNRASRVKFLVILGILKEISLFFDIFVEYTKTNIHLIVGEIGGYLPRRSAAW